MSNFFADISSKIIALADPVLSQPGMEREMVSPPAGVYLPSFTICHVLPDLPGQKYVEHSVIGTGIQYQVPGMIYSIHCMFTVCVR
jgi:hypothetical protein